MTLGQLIRRCYEQSGMTWPQLVERAKAKGHTITREYLLQITKSEIRSVPELQTMEAIAAALDVDLREVYLAAGVSLGIRVHDPVQIDPGVYRVATLLSEATEEERAAFMESLAAQERLLKVARQSRSLVHTGPPSA